MEKDKCYRIQYRSRDAGWHEPEERTYRTQFQAETIAEVNINLDRKNYEKAQRQGVHVEGLDLLVDYRIIEEDRVNTDEQPAASAADGLPSITALTFSPDGRYLAAANARGVIAVVRRDTGVMRQVSQRLGATWRIVTLAFSTDGALLAAGDSGGRVTSRRVDTLEAAQHYKHKHLEAIPTFGFHQIMNASLRCC
jgi:glucose/arabinose dehydrogenase